MSEDSRRIILERIRRQSQLQDVPQELAPPEVWPITSPDRNELLERFAAELQAVHGQAIRCDGPDQAKAALVELVEQAGWQRIGYLQQDGLKQLVAALPAEKTQPVTADWSAEQIAELDVGIITADFLLADTGSCVVVCRQAHERLMCYLPPNCIVVSQAGRVFEHLPAAWPEVVRVINDPQMRGEVVIITGPSRTADIEKILILGVHGPKRLVVLLVD